MFDFKEPQEAKELLSGGYDLHVHSGPCRFPRAYDDADLLKALHGAGMAGAVVKSHFQGTSSRAALANRLIPGKARLFGSIALNHPVGGLNPSAVENEILFGGKVVWFPTVDAENNRAFSKGLRPSGAQRAEGIRVLSSEGDLLKVVHEILDIVLAADVALATGHLSAEEACVLCAEGVARGHGKMILTHPDWGGVRLPLSRQIELAERGVFIEKSLLTLDSGDTDAALVASDIKAIGAERCFLTSDYGKAGHTSVPEGLSRFFSLLTQNGISPEQISLMIRHTPSFLLGE